MKYSDYIERLIGMLSATSLEITDIFKESENNLSDKQVDDLMLTKDNLHKLIILLETSAGLTEPIH